MNTPRVVLVTRPTEYEQLLAQHGTHGQAAFFLKGRGQNIETVFALHEQFKLAQSTVLGSIPAKWRRAQVARGDLDRFLFEEDDLIITLGPDGLVPNVAKYLQSQTVIGINPHPNLFDGILSPHDVSDTKELLDVAYRQAGNYQLRTMVQAKLDDGQKLVALNEIYLGHQTHQSARYQLDFQGASEYHSSSGMIVITGTGATGWGKSVSRAYKSALDLPRPQDNKLAFFVREAFPSKATKVNLTEGIIQTKPLVVTSKMDDAGVLFGDGIEVDYLSFLWGQTVTFSLAEQKLKLLVS